jgi:hypothetical protein
MALVTFSYNDPVLTITHQEQHRNIEESFIPARVDIDHANAPTVVVIYDSIGGRHAVDQANVDQGTYATPSGLLAAVRGWIATSNT